MEDKNGPHQINVHLLRTILMMLNLSPAQQMVVVLTDSWSAVPARLFCFEKSDNIWVSVCGPFDAVVGSNGMAWGIGFPEHEQGEPTKNEGDCKTPAGVFRLVKAMGYAKTAPEGSTLPYEQIRESHYCVDDPASQHYNRIVDCADPRNPIIVNWKSSELMKWKDDLYKWLIVVDYNRDNPIPDAGSCIFIHVWHSKDKGTAGCTAMAEPDIISLLKWLKPELHPLLVQLPRLEYEGKRIEWKLPVLEK